MASMKPQVRAMIDTNVYELLYKNPVEKIFELVETGKLVVYGCRVVRKELRDISPKIMVNNKNYRTALLRVYDEMAAKHDVPVSELSEVLANQYIKEYKGGVARYKIHSDFLIVATATIHKLDIIISHDERTMKSGSAKKAYDTVNNKNGLTTPNFIRLEELYA